MKFPYFLIICMIIASNNSLTAQPIDEERPERFYLFAGVFRPGIASGLRLDSRSAEIGTPLQLEDELGLARNATVFRGDLRIRLSPRFALTGSWFRVNRDASAYISRQIEFRDTIYEAGALVHTVLNTSFASAALQYSLLNDEIIQAGLSLGLRWVSLKSSIEATVDETNVKQAFEGEAPAPLPGVYVSVWLHPSLQFRYSFDYFQLSMSGISGRITDHRVAAAWYPLRNVGAGVSWSDITYQVEEIPFNNDFRGKLDYKLSGFSFFAAVRF